MQETVFDAVVIGSGATGGWAAKQLTEAGMKVALLEAGRKVTPAEAGAHPRPARRSLRILLPCRTTAATVQGIDVRQVRMAVDAPDKSVLPIRQAGGEHGKKTLFSLIMVS